MSVSLSKPGCETFGHNDEIVRIGWGAGMEVAWSCRRCGRLDPATLPATSPVSAVIGTGV